MLPTTIENAQDSESLKKFQQETVYFVRGRVSTKEKFLKKLHNQSFSFLQNPSAKTLEINSMEDVN